MHSYERNQWTQIVHPLETVSMMLYRDEKYFIPLSFLLAWSLKRSNSYLCSSVDKVFYPNFGFFQDFFFSLTLIFCNFKMTC